MNGAGGAGARALGEDPTRQEVLQRWDPEDPQFWGAHGAKVARRNLAVSVVALMLSFVVYTLCALVAAQLGNAGYSFDTGQLFLLTALPGLVGATGRLFYTYLPARFGGRNVTFVTTALMLVPLLGLAHALQDPTTPYGAFVAWFALMGLALSNFSASMANIAFFFPTARKGTANGINAGIGNLGVAVAYFVTPVAIAWSPGQGVGPAAAGAQVMLQNACLVWVVPIVVVLVLVAVFMDNVPVPRQSAAQMASVFRDRHTWLMTLIYTCSFGSFIGYSMALALIVGTVFPEVDASYMMFFGPLIGALSRPVGGWLSDRIDSGANVCLASFVAMVAATLAVLAGIRAQNFGLFFAAFLVLFLACGLANGGSFRMIPNVFADRASGSQVTGFASAVAAYGAFAVPFLFRADFHFALVALAVFTAVTALVTWWVYARPGAAVRC